MGYSQTNGHKIIYNNDKWAYVDTGEIVDKNKPRPCKCCGKLPTKEGHDGCLGHLEGVKHACCGHGDEKLTYAVLESGKCIRFNDINEMKKYFRRE